MRGARSGIVAVLATSGLLVSTSPPTASGDEASRERARSTVRFSESTTDEQGVTLRGVVDSPKARCEKDRRVVVRALGGRVVGRDRTDEFGRFVVRFPITEALPGSFEGTAPRVTVRGLVCRSGRATVTLGPPDLP